MNKYVVILPLFKDYILLNNDKIIELKNKDYTKIVKNLEAFIVSSKVDFIARTIEIEVPKEVNLKTTEDLIEFLNK